MAVTVLTVPATERTKDGSRSYHQCQRGAVRLEGRHLAITKHHFDNSLDKETDKAR